MEADANEELPTAITQAKDIKTIENVNTVATWKVDVANANVVIRWFPLLILLLCKQWWL